MSSTAPIHDISATATLDHGVEIPRLGFGTFKIEDGDPVVEAVTTAIEAGYRHIDTAAVYQNEAGVGRAVRECGVPREELFVTTKCWNDDLRKGPEAIGPALDASLDRLGLDHVDLYLVHWPAGDFVSYWPAFEALPDTGKTRAVGVSNFTVAHLKRLFEAATRKPAVNQIEYHPRLQQPELQGFSEAHGVVVEAWSPLLQGKLDELDGVDAIAEAHGKTAAQVVLRWELQKGVVTIPKSSTPGRIRENADVFDFTLSDEQMASIDALDAGERIGPDPDDFSF